MRILTLLIPLIITASCAKPTLEIASPADVGDAGKRQRLFCWARHARTEEGQEILYFIFDQDKEVTYFYYFHNDVVVGKDGDRTSVEVHKLIRKGDEEGVWVRFEKGSLSMKYGEEIKEKRLYFIFEGVDLNVAMLSRLLPSVNVGADTAHWIFEITKGVELPGKDGRMLSDPRAFILKQYKKNR